MSILGRMKQILFKANKEEAKKAFNQGEYNHSISAVDRAIQADPNNPVLYLNKLTLELVEIMKWQISDFDQAIKLADPKDINIMYKIYCARGCTYNLKGNYDHAISDFDQAIKLKPNHLLAYINRGVSYQMKKDHASAIRDYSKVIAVSPDCHKAYLNRAGLYEELGQYQQAIQDYEKAIEVALPGDCNIESMKMITIHIRQLKGFV